MENRPAREPTVAEPVAQPAADNVELPAEFLFQAADSNPVVVSEFIPMTASDEDEIVPDIGAATVLDRPAPPDSEPPAFLGDKRDFSLELEGAEGTLAGPLRFLKEPAVLRIISIVGVSYLLYLLRALASVYFHRQSSSVLDYGCPTNKKYPSKNFL